MVEGEETRAEDQQRQQNLRPHAAPPTTLHRQGIADSEKTLDTDGENEPETRPADEDRPDGGSGRPVENHEETQLVGQVQTAECVREGEKSHVGEGVWNEKEQEDDVCQGEGRQHQVRPALLPYTHCSCLRGKTERLASCACPARGALTG